MATMRSFGNMLNQMKPMKSVLTDPVKIQHPNQPREPKVNVWGHVLTKRFGGGK